jgi:hypothetical protein
MLATLFVIPDNPIFPSPDLLTSYPDLTLSGFSC